MTLTPEQKIISLERYNQKQKEWKEKHPDYHKNYYRKNKQYFKDYWEKHRERILAKQKGNKIYCEPCDKQISRYYLPKHIHTYAHLRNITK